MMTRKQFAIFKYWKELNETPNPDRLIRSARYRTIVSAAGLCILYGVATTFLAGLPAGFVAFWIGLVLGILVSNEIRLSLLKKMLPILREIVDWKKLDQLLELKGKP